MTISSSATIPILRPFRDLRRAAGTSFFLIAFMGRLPVAMIVVGMLTMVTAVRGSIVEAGITSATVGLASGLGGPLVGAAADRWGQRWVLTIAAALNASAILGAVATIQNDGPIWSLMIASAFVGLTVPQLSPLARARWITLINKLPDGTARPAHASVAMSYESTADELAFLFGPVLVGLLASLITPAAPLVLAAVVTVVFVSAFAWHRTAPLSGSAQRMKDATGPVLARNSVIAFIRPLLAARVLLPVIGMTMIGTLFGTTLTCAAAFMAERGIPEQTGLMYGAMGITSAACALGVAYVSERVKLHWRWVAASVILILGVVALPVVTELWQMVVLLLVTGVGVGPMLVTIFSIGARVAPRDRLTTVMAMLSSGIIVGQAIATGVSGTVAGAGGYTAVATLVVGAAIACLALSLANARVSRRYGPRPVLISCQVSMSG